MYQLCFNNTEMCLTVLRGFGSGPLQCLVTNLKVNLKTNLVLL